jgi:hypothetical protein
MDENRLRDTLDRIEALFLGAKTSGERTAAASALERFRARLKEIQKSDPPVEYKFGMNNHWSRKLLVALLRRYGINPYRYWGQKHTTVMARVSVGFVKSTLWPEFLELDKILTAQVDDLTERLIADSVHADSSEATVKQGPCLLGDET